MTIVNCHECGKDVSTEAAACPHCGAEPRIEKRENLPILEPQKNVASSGAKWLLLILPLVVIVGFIAASSMNPDTKARDIANKVETDYSRPLYTKDLAAVCPALIVLDKRVGRGLKAAEEAMTSTFGRDEAFEKAGCEQWKAGIRVYISPEYLPEKGKSEWVRVWLHSDQVDFTPAAMLIPNFDLTNQNP